MRTQETTAMLTLRLHKLSLLMLDAHVRHCVREGMKGGKADETIESLAEAIESFSKMA